MDHRGDGWFLGSLEVFKGAFLLRAIVLGYVGSPPLFFHAIALRATVALFNLGICWGAPPRLPWTLPGNQLGSASILAMSLPMASSVGRAFRRVSFVTASTNPLIQVFRP